MSSLNLAGRIVAVAVWMVLALSNAGWWLGYSRDVGSGILVLLALLIGAAAAYCLGRAVDARRERVGLLWAGRALALVGATFAVAFPSVLYGEIVMLSQQGKSAGYDIEAALWHSIREIPLGVLPGLVALRWGRIGGLLLLALTAYGIADGVYHFGGVNYFPQASTNLMSQVIQTAPAVVTAALLFLGSEGWRGEESITQLSA